MSLRNRESLGYIMTRKWRYITQDHISITTHWVKPVYNKNKREWESKGAIGWDMDISIEGFGGKAYNQRIMTRKEIEQ